MSSRLPMGVATTYSTPGRSVTAAPHRAGRGPERVSLSFAPILQRKPASMQGTPLLRLCRLGTALLLALLAACAVTPSKQPPATREAQASQFMQEGKYADAAALYENLAAGAQEQAQTEYLVSAAEAWSDAGNRQRSWELLGNIKIQKALYP